MTFVNVSFQIIMSFFAHEFHEFNVCARRAQKPSLLGLCRTAAKRLLKTNVSVKPNGQSSNLLEYSATVRKRELISNWRTRRGCVKIGAASLFCNILKNIKQSPDFHKPGLCHVKKFLYLYDK